MYYTFDKKRIETLNNKNTLTRNATKIPEIPPDDKTNFVELF